MNNTEQKVETSTEAAIVGNTVLPAVFSSIEDRIAIEAFITGATSKHVEKQKLEFAIEQLNKLDSVLQAKYEILSNMQQEYLGKMKEGQLASKKSGLRLAKEETRRNIKELEQQLNDL